MTESRAPTPRPTLRGVLLLIAGLVMMVAPVLGDDNKGPVGVGVVFLVLGISELRRGGDRPPGRVVWARTLVGLAVLAAATAVLIPMGVELTPYLLGAGVGIVIVVVVALIAMRRDGPKDPS